MNGIYLYYIPVIFLAQIQASHAGEIQHDGKKNSVSTHGEIRFQIWYDDVSHERTTFQILFLRNIVKIIKRAGGECVISLFLETHVYFH